METTNNATRPRGVGYRAAIVKYLFDNLGRVVSLDELCTVSGASEHTAQTTISHLAAQRPAPGLKVEVITRGRNWRARVAPDAPEQKQPEQKHPARPAKRDDRVFQVIGTTQDGSLVLEADDTTLWKAVQL